MKYVKLIALPDTWFKEGTEVYQYDCHPPMDCRRIPLDEWIQGLQEGGINARGIRVVETTIEAKNLGMEIGEERWDGEWCKMDEFSSEISEEPK